VTGDEDYGGRDLRRAIRALGMGYVLAVRANHTLALGSGRTLAAGLGWERKRTELTRRPWSPSSLAWRGLPGPTDSRSASGGMSGPNGQAIVAQTAWPILSVAQQLSPLRTGQSAPSRRAKERPSRAIRFGDLERFPAQRLAPRFSDCDSR
jgi:hypothetical protein